MRNGREGRARHCRAASVQGRDRLFEAGDHGAQVEGEVPSGCPLLKPRAEDRERVADVLRRPLGRNRGGSGFLG
jgi:hypothetical protein